MLIKMTTHPPPPPEKIGGTQSPISCPSPDLMAPLFIINHCVKNYINYEWFRSKKEKKERKKCWLLVL